MAKKLDPDLKALRMADRAMMGLTLRMRAATLQYLWDKYVIHPKVEIPAEDQTIKASEEKNADSA